MLFQHFKSLLSLRFLFEQDPDGGGGGAGGDGKKEEGKTEGNKPKPITIESQEVLDQMFTERAKQGGRAALDVLFKALGVKDENELKTLFAEGKQLKDSQLSDLQKAQADKTTADTALTTEKAAHDETKKSFTERLLKAEIKAAAKKAGFRDESLDDVWMLVKAEHRDKITEKDEAFQGIDKVVEDIKKVRAFWLDGETTTEKKPKTPGSPKGGKKPGDGTGTSTQDAPRASRTL